MTLSIGNKIGLGFAVALAALVAIGVSTSRNLKELDDDSFWVRHTIEVKAHVASFLASILNSESHARGYELAPAAELKVQFAQSSAQAEAEVKTLSTLTIDNPVEIANLARLAPIVQTRLTILRQMIQLRDQMHGWGALSDNRLLAMVQEGQGEMSQIEQVAAAMNAEEDRLLALRQDRAAHMRVVTGAVIAYGTIAAFALVLLAGYLVTRSIVQPLRILGQGANRIGGGEYGHRVKVKSRDEVGRLAELFNRMAGQVQQRQSTLAEQDWLKGALARFAAIFQGQRDPRRLCEQVLAELADLLDARPSAIYVARETDGGASLRLMAAHAAENLPEWVGPRQGLVGQALADGRRIVLTEIPENYLRIRSALGEGPPAAVAVLPARYEDGVKAVVELATWKPLTAVQLDMLDQFAASLGIVLNTIEGAQRTEDLLRQSQQLAESLRASELELQEQQEELKQTNEELEQTNEEMQQTNEEMEEKVHLLAEQKKELEQANAEVGRAREKLEEQARLVSQASMYKSDFLASMSHELRTPLNSMLILARMLADNGEATLSSKQVQYAETIYSSGNDLLELINEILDLSKIESGNVEVENQAVPLAALRRFLIDGFQPVADAKKLEFQVEMDPSLPEAVRTDERRIQQILKNLLSNAFKFTDRGSVTLSIAPVTSGWDRGVGTLNAAATVVAFTVKDTGIGIPPEKQQLIFEAFQQADAGTARKYGGTGLGLSISRELAWLLGGAISLSSESGLGSAFTLYLPAAPAAGGSGRSRRREAEAPAPGRGGASTPATLDPDPEGIPDDRASLQPGDLVLLV